MSTLSTRNLTVLLVLGLALVIACRESTAELPYAVAWDSQFGTSSGDSVFDISLDGAGHLYVGGVLGLRPFLAKYDSAGDEIWTVQEPELLSNFLALAHGTATDGMGGIYLSGEFNSIEGDCCDQDVFLYKYDGDGQIVWKRTIRNDWDEYNARVSADPLGNVFVVGETWGSLAAPNPIRLPDVFVAKFDSAGDLKWTRQFGADDFEDGANSVAVDGLGNAYVAGYLSFEDGFISKFDSSGTQLWTTVVELGILHEVYADDEGNLFAVGRSDTTIASPDGLNSGTGGLLAKFDTSGDLLWARQSWSAGQSSALSSVDIDDNGNVFVSGQTQDLNALVAVFGQDGTFKGEKEFSSPGREGFNAIAVDGGEDIFLGGVAYGSLFGPNLGSYDATLVRLTIPEPTSCSLLVGSVALMGMTLRRKRRAGS